jgi:hypothetical protein
MEKNKLELQNEINKQLNSLLNSEFSKADYDLILINLIRGIRLLADGISERVDLIELDKSGKNKERFLSDINERCYVVGTLCETIEQKLNVAEFEALYKLICNQKQLTLNTL